MAVLRGAGHLVCVLFAVIGTTQVLACVCPVTVPQDHFCQSGTGKDLGRYLPRTTSPLICRFHDIDQEITLFVIIVNVRLDFHFLKLF